MRSESLAELVERSRLRFAQVPDRPSRVEGNYDVPEGWIPLVERLAQRLIRLGWNRRLAQAQPKFGGLRLYVAKKA